MTEALFEDTDLLLAQKFMPTDFDWRVGVLDGEPLFVCQYQMARATGRSSNTVRTAPRKGASKRWRSPMRRRA